MSATQLLELYDQRLIKRSEEALFRWHRGQELVEILRSAEPDSLYWQSHFAELKSLVPSGRWEHFESPRLERMHYVVLGVGHRAQQGDFEVACIASSGPHKGNLRFLPLLAEGGFLTPIFDGKRWKPRFSYVMHLPSSFEQFLELVS